ncbi:MAG: transglutaminase domain-containing protein [Xanthobacteraceae bacterium]|nr:MAG: transglutaminase domain-containing protein [Xanthobacteraceae bacterium]
MTLDRRDFMKAGAAVAVGALMPGAAMAQTAFAPTPGVWRKFQLTTRLEIAQPKGRTQAWVPLPSFNAPDWFHPSGSTWRTNAATAMLARDPKYGAGMLYLQWDAGEPEPGAEITSRFAVRDRAIDLTAPGSVPALSAQERRLYLEATDLIPTDGIVKATADRITAGAGSDLAKARAIYEWVVDNTFRDAATRGCGSGDVAAMLRTGNLGGKCADLNALFVGLARAVGIPARDVYGLRIAPSKFGYRSLGAETEIVSKAQHCRAEVWLAGFGWVPADPADVRKVALEEPPGNLPLSDARVVAVRDKLFGAWETNWLAYNVAHDVRLPWSEGPALGFLMYPQAETASLRLDCLDPDTFRYALKATELPA